MNESTLPVFDFDTERLHLRPLCLDDEAFFSNLYGDPETMRFIASPLSTAQAILAFRRTLSRMQHSSRKGFSLVMVEKNSSKPVGICGTAKFDLEAGCIEVGILLLPEGQSRGLGKEALKTLMEKIFAALPVDEIRVNFCAKNRIVELMNISLGFTPSLDDSEDGTDPSMRKWSLRRPLQAISQTEMFN